MDESTNVVLHDPVRVIFIYLCYISVCFPKLNRPFPYSRFRTQDAQNNDDQPGGQFTLGGTNSSLYDGNINFVNLVRPLYWTIPMTALGTQGGATIPISGSTQNAAIDTGTTLIGGPSSILDPFYNEIPGSARGSTLDPSLQDYYIIRK